VKGSVVFIPKADADKVHQALGEAGAGKIDIYPMLSLD